MYIYTHIYVHIDTYLYTHTYIFMVFSEIFRYKMWRVCPGLQREDMGN